VIADRAEWRFEDFLFPKRIHAIEEAVPKFTFEIENPVKNGSVFLLEIQKR
jgi:hypothetical protein